MNENVEMRRTAIVDAFEGLLDDLDIYIHTYYEDTDSLCRDRIFTLGMSDHAE